MAKVILHLIESWGPGGAEKIVLELCRNLSKKSFRPVVGLLRDGWLNQALLSNGIETVILKDRFSFDPFFIYQLLRVIYAYKVDIIHSHEFLMNVYGTFAAILTRKPIIVTIHGKNYYWEKFRRRLAYRIMSYFATKIVAVSQDLKKFIVEKTGIKEKKIKVIYNGIDLNMYSDISKTDKKTELGLKGFIVGSVGNIYPVKGYIYLIRAAHKVLKVYPEVTFLIAGKITPYLKELEWEVNLLGLSDNIKFLGFREDIPDLLKLVDLYVSSSLSEGISLSILQAMASGKPVIATDVGGNPEILENGETGILVQPENSDELADAIIMLIRDRQLASMIGQKARKVVKERFSLESMIAEYINLYESCLKL